MVNLATAMPRDLVDLTLAVGTARGEAREWIAPEIEFHDLGASRLFKTAVPLARLIYRIRPDVVLSTMMDANVMAFMSRAMVRSDAALVLRETNSQSARTELGALRKTLAKIAYRRADCIVALSEGVRRELVVDMHLDERKTVTIPNPVFVGSIRRGVEAARFKSPPIEFVAGHAHILAIGRLHKQKGFDVLLRAVALRLPDVHVTLLGEGSERAVLASLAEELGIASRVHLPGFVSDTAPYLAHADLFVLSSRWEGFGHVIVEAMAAGLPVVATDCPYGPADIIRDGKTGLLVKPEDAESLASAIGRVLSDNSFSRELASAGALVAHRYESDQVAREYAIMLGDVVQTRRMSGRTVAR